jgi:hypothetical protein
LLDFIGYEARSFDCGEYAFAQDAPWGRFGIEDRSAEIAVFGGRDAPFTASQLVTKTRSLEIAMQISQIKKEAAFQICEICGSYFLSLRAFRVFVVNIPG